MFKILIKAVTSSEILIACLTHIVASMAVSTCGHVNGDDNILWRQADCHTECFSHK